MTLPRWRLADERNLQRRVRRLVDRATAAAAAEMAQPARSRPPARLAGGCGECGRDHRHRAVRIGPFVICRCLSCPVLVVRP